MRPRTPLLSFFALIALTVNTPAAVAQEPGPGGSAPPAPTPRWSLGAGLSVFRFGDAFASTSPFDVDVPMANAELERRLTDRTWLVLGVAGTVRRERMDVPEGRYGYARNDLRSVTLTGGVRRIIGPAGAPVEVSLLLLGEAGVAFGDFRFGSGGSETKADASGWTVGGNAGIAVDRELTGNLSLRAASPLVAAAWSSNRVNEAGQPAREGSSLSVAALVAPRLELRLAF